MPIESQQLGARVVVEGAVPHKAEYVNLSTVHRRKSSVNNLVSVCVSSMVLMDTLSELGAPSLYI